MSDQQTIHVIISGRVQGVGYRSWTVSQARKLGLDGWVRNRRDGSVEAIFHGSFEAIEAMLIACEDGPLAARVREVRKRDAEESVENGFRQRETI
jgi:acylphosphatase